MGASSKTSAVNKESGFEQRLVPAVTDLQAIGVRHGIRRWPQLTGKRKAGRGVRPVKPTLDPIAPPTQKRRQPRSMLGKFPLHGQPRGRSGDSHGCRPGGTGKGRAWFGHLFILRKQGDSRRLPGRGITSPLENIGRREVLLNPPHSFPIKLSSGSSSA